MNKIIFILFTAMCRTAVYSAQMNIENDCKTIDLNNKMWGGETALAWAKRLKRTAAIAKLLNLGAH